MGHAPKIDSYTNKKRMVRVMPDVGFGPYEVDAASDEKAARYVVRNILDALIKAGAVKEKVDAVCGKVRVPAA